MTSLTERLQKHKEDRGLMANLRCMLVESKEHRAWPALSRLGIGVDKKNEALIAGLFAYHPEVTNSGNFGDTCHLIKNKRDSQGNDEQLTPIERRFQYLLVAERDEIGKRVWRFILLAKAEGVPVNYEQLRTDLNFWGSKVKRRWAAAFWNVGGVEPEEEVE